MALDVFQPLSRDWPQLRLIMVPRHRNGSRRSRDAGRLGRGLAAAERVGSGTARAPAQTKMGLPRRSLLPTRLACCWSMWWANWGPGGERPNRLRRRQPGQSRRAEHDRAGGLRGGRLFGPNTRNFRDIVAAMLAAMRPWSWPTAMSYFASFATAWKTRPTRPPWQPWACPGAPAAWGY